MSIRLAFMSTEAKVSGVPTGLVYIFWDAMKEQHCCLQILACAPCFPSNVLQQLSVHVPHLLHGSVYIMACVCDRWWAAPGAAMAALNHRLLRLEDVAMGSWIQFVCRDKGWKVELRTERGFNFGGCRGGDLVSHYITPKAMLCMAKQRREQCCSEAGEPRGARLGRFGEPNMGLL